jgi:uncharacterized protein
MSSFIKKLVFFVMVFCLFSIQSVSAAKQKISFSKLEIAQTSQEIQTGLMGRKSLCSKCAMLFIFKEPGHYAFWMKNTLIPLDIIFITKKGKIANIYQNTVPMNEEIHYWPSEEISFVLEMNSGASKKLGLMAGQILDLDYLHKASKKAPAKAANK